MRLVAIDEDGQPTLEHEGHEYQMSFGFEGDAEFDKWRVLVVARRIVVDSDHAPKLDMALWKITEILSGKGPAFELNKGGEGSSLQETFRGLPNILREAADARLSYLADVRAVWSKAREGN